MKVQAYDPSQVKDNHWIGSPVWVRHGLLADAMLQSTEDFSISIFRERTPAARYIALATNEGDVLYERFQKIYSKWLQDSLFDSSSSQMRRHASYQQLVDLGPPAIPLIAAELRREPSFGFLALADITGHDPVPNAVNGKLNLIVSAWLKWLRR